MELNIFGACAVCKIFAVRAQRKTIAKMRFVRVPVSCLKVNGKFQIFVPYFYKRDIRVIVLVFRKNYFVSVSLRKLHDFRKQMDFQYFYDFRVRRNGIDILEYIDEPLDGPLTVLRADVPFQAANKLLELTLEFFLSLSSPQPFQSCLFVLRRRLTPRRSRQR